MKFFIFFILLFFSLITINVITAQTKIIPDSRLYARYSEGYLTNLKEKSPETLAYLNYSLDHSFYFINDDDKFKNSEQLKLFDNSTKSIFEDNRTNIDTSSFNLFNYDFELNYNQRTFYKIGDNQVIVFYSLKEMAEKFNNYIKSVK